MQNGETGINRNRKTGGQRVCDSYHVKDPASKYSPVKNLKIKKQKL